MVQSQAASEELNFTELIAFDRQYAGFMEQYKSKRPDAAFGIDWYDAVDFCRWLTVGGAFPQRHDSHSVADTHGGRSCHDSRTIHGHHGVGFPV